LTVVDSTTDLGAALALKGWCPFGLTGRLANPHDSLGEDNSCASIIGINIAVEYEFSINGFPREI
jgi:hypothetical protein